MCDFESVTTCLERSKVNDTVYLGVFGENIVERGLVCNIDLVKGRALARDQLDAIQGDLGRVVKVVDDHDLVIMLQKSESSE